MPLQPIANGSRRNLDTCCWPDCYREPEHHELPLCEPHYRDVGMHWIRDNIELIRAVSGVAEQDIMFDRVMRDARARLPEKHRLDQLDRDDHAARHSVVYYLDLGDRIKIGYTAHLTRRLADFRLDPSVVLATERGGCDVETRRHREFADERYGRKEDFAKSDRLMAHIAALAK